MINKSKKMIIMITIMW